MKKMLFFLPIFLFLSGCTQVFVYVHKDTLALNLKKQKVAFCKKTNHSICKKQNRLLTKEKPTVEKFLKIYYELKDGFTYVDENITDIWTDLPMYAKKTSGDCEDFAFLLYKRLLNAGFHPKALEVWAGFAENSKKTVGHAWIIVKGTDGMIVADNDLVDAVPSINSNANFSVTEETVNGEKVRIHFYPIMKLNTN